MAIKDSTQIKDFEFIVGGRPFMNIEVNSQASTTTFEYNQKTDFFIGASGTVTVVTSNNVYVKTDSGWTNVQEIYINVSGTWKRVNNDKFYVKSSDGTYKS